MVRAILILFGASILLISSCARSYRPCNPSYVNYTNNKKAGKGITVSYAYDLQYENRNKRYSKKEKKHNMALIGVKIENMSNRNITLTKENFKITTAMGNYVPLINPKLYTKKVRQSSESYLLYLLNGVSYTYEETDEGTNEEIGYNPIYLLIGVGNLIYAEAANIKHKRDIREKYILNKTVPAKSTLYGLLIIPENNYQELQFEIVE